jgi:hypothetical protein
VRIANRAGVIAAFFGILFAGEACAGADLCPDPELRNAQGISMLIKRVANAESTALKRAQAALGCFDQADTVRLSRACGEFFDARPREYLEGVRGNSDDPTLLEAIAYPPEKLDGDAGRELELLKQRSIVFDTHRMVLDDSHQRFLVVLSFWDQVGKRTRESIEKLTKPRTHLNPLFGIEIERDKSAVEPTPLDFLSIADQARGDFGISYAEFRDPLEPSRIYVVIGGEAFEYAKDDPARAIGYVHDPGWIERVVDQDRRTVVEKIGPASSLTTNEALPFSVRMGLLESAVRRLRVDGDHLQQLFDERIAKHPEAGLAKPLRDALMKQGFDLRRYREIPLPRP